jgi:hypothetical protein
VIRWAYLDGRLEKEEAIDTHSWEEDRPSLPQVERELLVHVDKILAFSQGPHSDVAE